MKRLLILYIMCTILFFTACSNSNEDLELGDSSNETLHYVMDIDTENDVYLPLLEIDKHNQTFSITNDVLSSTIIGGTYEVKDNILIAKTFDKQEIYQFEIIDSSMLKFIQDNSSTFRLTDEEIGIPIVDGSIFKLQSE